MMINEPARKSTRTSRLRLYQHRRWVGMDLFYHTNDTTNKIMPRSGAGPSTNPLSFELFDVAFGA
jgi:hypothetical protein